MVKKLLKKSFKIIINPQKEFSNLHKKVFEDEVNHYLKLLVLVALMSAVFNFIFNFLRAFYLDLFLNVEIDYLRLLNYVLSASSSTAFFYIIAGTFFVFILTTIVNIFIKKIKYTELIKITFYSLTPLLLFGWIPQLVSSLFIWGGFLFVMGIRGHKDPNITKDSIEHRD